MAKLDKLLELMNSRGAERALLISDQPIQLYVGEVKQDSWLLTAAQLSEAIEEVLPVAMQAVYRSGSSNFHFVYNSPRGNYDLGVAKVKGLLQATISPIIDEPTVTPTGELISRPAPKPAVVPTASNEDFISSPWSSPVNDIESTSLIPTQEADYCVLHPTELAAGVCEYSRKPYCRDCLVEINGRFYGKENLKLAMASGQSSQSVTSATLTGPTETKNIESDVNGLSRRSKSKGQQSGISLFWRAMLRRLLGRSED